MASASVHTEYVTVGGTVRSFLARPQQAGAFPAVVLLHERYGLFQHTLDLAVRFALEGYVCLAPDLYWRVTDEATRASLLAGDISIPLPDPQVGEDVGACLDYMKDLPSVDAARLGVMGVCLTGRYPITVGANRTDLRALVVFYGGAQEREWEVNENQPEAYADLFPRLSAPVLGVFGERDHVVPVPWVREFRNHMERANKSHEVAIYRDMPHGWLNDQMPGRYRPRGAALAWRQLMDFLERAFGDGYPPDRVQGRFESDVSTDYDPSKNVRFE